MAKMVFDMNLHEIFEKKNTCINIERTQSYQTQSVYMLVCFGFFFFGHIRD